MLKWRDHSIQEQASAAASSCVVSASLGNAPRAQETSDNRSGLETWRARRANLWKPQYSYSTMVVAVDHYDDRASIWNTDPGSNWWTHWVKRAEVQKWSPRVDKSSMPQQRE